MGYTNSRAAMKCWDPHTKKLKYCSYTKFDKHYNKFVKLWLHDSELMTGKNNSTPTTLKTDHTYRIFIKDDIYEVNVNSPPKVTRIGIFSQY